MLWICKYLSLSVGERELIYLFSIKHYLNVFNEFKFAIMYSADQMPLLLTPYKSKAICQSQQYL